MKPIESVISPPLSIAIYHSEGPPIFDRNQDQVFHLKQMKQVVEGDRGRCSLSLSENGSMKTAVPVRCLVVALV